MSQNVEMAVLLDRPTTRDLGFSWHDLIHSMLSQPWELYRPTLADLHAPVWQLLYDEEAATVVLDETEEVTMILLLGHADTVRIMADPGTAAARGTQYFWLSKDCYDFFPPLTILNRRGHKTTYSTLVDMRFIDLGLEEQCRVTFEAENNFDFRLGTGPLRGTKVAQAGDLAAVSRVGEHHYELRLYRQGSSRYASLRPYAVNFIGHRGKRYGFLSNEKFQAVIGERIGRASTPAPAPPT
jgi:hypothetical protein